MKRLYLLLLFIFFVFSVYKVYGQQERLQFKHLTTEDGLSQSTIACILQDSKGFMWFGTQDGLNKYDGYNFTIFQHDPDNPASIMGSFVFEIFEDSNGNLWIGTESGLNLFNRADNVFIHYQHDENDPNSLGGTEVRTICEDSRDNLWVGTIGGGLNLFDRENESFIHYQYEKNDPNTLSSNDVYVVFEDSRNNLWIGSGHGDLDLFDRENEVFHHYYDKNKKLGNDEIWDITEDRDGNLWISTYKNGLYKMNFTDKGESEFIHYTHDVNDVNSLSGNAIFTVFEDSKGRLWICTENGGLNIFDRENGKFVHYRSDAFDDNSLNNNSIWSIYEDKTGNLWFGTHAGGINLLPRYGGYFSHYKHYPGNKNSLSHNSVTSFYEDSGHNFWIGTDGGGLNLFNRETETFIHYDTQNSNLSSDAVLSIFEDSRGNFWIGTWKGGLNLFDREHRNFIQYTKENSGLSSNTIWAILEDKKGFLWVGAFFGGISYYDRNRKTFINYTPENSNLSDNFVKVIAVDSYGNLWVGGALGLNLFNPETETFIIYKHDENNDKSLSKGYVLSILEAGDSTLWIGTTGGLNKFDRKKQSFTHYYVKDGLPNDVIKGIREDEQGNLWLSTNRGLSKFNPETEIFENYDTSDGLQDNEFYQCSHYKSSDGEIFFGGVNGFNAFFPKDIIYNPEIPPIVITDFQIFNKPVGIGKDSPLQVHISEAKKINLSYKHSVFSFEFAALNYISSNKNQYSYKLDGFDPDWNYVGTKHTATYTNLDPGEYVFRVKGSNNNGRWNEEGTSIRVIIHPPWWKTKFAYALYMFAIIFIIYAFIKFKERKLQKDKKVLEKKVKERTAEIVRQKNKIQEKNEELTQQKEEIVAQRDEIENQRDQIVEQKEAITKSIEYASQIQSALLPPDGLIKYIFTKYFILFKPRDIVSGDFYWIGLKNNKIIFAVADCTGHGVPGALMSILGGVMLNEVVNKIEVLQANEILNELKEKVIKSLRLSGKESEIKVGIDIALCILDTKNKELQFSGANNPLYLIRDSEVNEIIPDWMPVGIGFEAGKSFTNHIIKIQKGDTIYLFSDGYADQFGGPMGKKFKYNQFKQLLLDIQDKIMPHQKKILKQTIEDWMNNTDKYGNSYKQVDDILVMGLRF